MKKRIDQYQGEIYIRDTVVIELSQGKILEPEIYVVKQDHAVMLNRKDYRLEGLIGNSA